MAVPCVGPRIPLPAVRFGAPDDQKRSWSAVGIESQPKGTIPSYLESRHLRSGGPDPKRLRLSLSGRPRRMMEEMGDSCERCGRPGKPCSIHDPTTSGKWKTLTLCDQCYGAIRQMDVRACKWFRRYCTRRNPLTPIFKTNQ